MSPLITAQYMAAASFLTMSLLFGAIWLRRSAATVHLLFAVAAFGAAGNAISEAFAYRATTVEAYAAAANWAVIFIILFIAALGWFITLYSKTPRRWPAVTLSAVLGVCLALHLPARFGFMFKEIETLHRLELPWGETYAVIDGVPSIWKPLADVPGLLLGIILIDACLWLRKRGEGQRAWALGGSLALFVISFGLLGPLVDWEVIQTPYLYTYGFLAMIALMGWSLASDVVRSSELAEQVARNEQRWRRLLDEVRLIVIGIDAARHVDYVNPYFLEVTGFDADRVLGHPFTEFTSQTERTNSGDTCERAMRDQTAESHSCGHLLTARGDRRRIEWSHVVLLHDDGRAGGCLSIGADTTERAAAEAERDRALAELELLKNRLEQENIHLREEILGEHESDTIIGRSDALRYVLHRVQQVAAADTTVLIQGETGVGKELIARAVHEASPRAGAPLLKIDCTALPAELIESELFGHETGAFTGATRQRLGRFELADGGTLFLDEIGELPVNLQAKLLRFLQEGEFERVGSSHTRHADVRIIAATNRELGEEVKAGRFREDLFYRLHVYPITVPPLRDRLEDIPSLVEHFVPRLAARVGRPIREIPGRLVHDLQNYGWPGNVRELQNVLERAILTSSDGRLCMPDRPAGLLVPQSGPAGEPIDAAGDAITTLAGMERRHIEKALRHTHGRIGGPGGAAELLDLHPNTLRSRMKKLGINGPRDAGQRQTSDRDDATTPASSRE